MLIIEPWGQRLDRRAAVLGRVVLDLRMERQYNAVGERASLFFVEKEP